MTFPIHDGTPVRFSAPLPPRADVVIVGGGVIGVMTAWFLRQKGLSVFLCEKGRIAGEQSSRNWGWVRQQGRDPGELPIMVESLSIWKRLAAELGEGLGFRQTGVMYLAKTDREIAGFEAWTEHSRAHQLDTRLLTAAEAAAMLNGAAAAWKGALWTASDARAEPWVAVPMLAAAAEDRGVMIREACAVRALDIAGGRVAGVVTEAGRVACDHVVVAAGAWSRLFLRRHGVRIPQLSVLASVGATGPMPEVFPGAAADDDFAFRRRADGGYTLAPGGSAHDFFIGRDAFASFFSYLPVLRNDFRATTFRLAAPKGFPDAWGTPRTWAEDAASPFEAMRILNPAPNLKTLGKVQDAFAAAFPALGRPRLASAWAGMIDTMPDVVPVVDHALVPGLTIATGMSGHGFGIGPGMGRVVADLVAGGAVGHDLSRFRLSRFSDGTKIRPGPSL
ncbi:FAD-binding oxidoreductase [Rhodobacter sp. SGA-6-6]|uniref:NAD(P)/FAD-dependent oxidoreductase n=1 Tax=Rhodobacter sp. SGA-6-6 TaxID=2710882 RepID=UPI0013EB5911|nr:FAD-binding oxidoreductase [Rhodobacter sp. SGA-6-6]NGM47124.1 FAD-binding oxidoreductase [Rhodobacter sp. SGA-6-6]